MAFTPLVGIVQANAANSGQPTHFTVSVSNAGSTTASVTAVQMVVSPGSFPALPQRNHFPVGTLPAIAQNTTAYFDATVVFHGPQLMTAPNNGGNQVDVQAIVTFSDGSVAMSPLLGVSPGQAMPQLPIQDRMDFSSGLNSGFLEFII